jgi:hypothetical protein
MDNGSRDDSDGDPSESCQVLLQLERHKGGKGVDRSTRLGSLQEGEVARKNSIISGNSLAHVKPLVNGVENGTSMCQQLNRCVGVDSVGSDVALANETNGMIENVSCSVVPPHIPFVGDTCALDTVLEGVKDSGRPEMFVIALDD